MHRDKDEKILDKYIDQTSRLSITYSELETNHPFGVGGVRKCKGMDRCNPRTSTSNIYLR